MMRAKAFGACASGLIVVLFVVVVAFCGSVGLTEFTEKGFSGDAQAARLAKMHEKDWSNAKDSSVTLIPGLLLQD